MKTPWSPRSLTSLLAAVAFVCLGAWTAGCAGTSPAPATAADSPAAETGSAEVAPGDEATYEPEPGAPESSPADLPPTPPKPEEPAPVAYPAAPEPGGDVPASPPADHAAVLDEALETFESSEVFWQRGDFEDAFAALDRAYELMASVPANGDPYVAQQREDLRHLISRRVVEIYASRQTAVGDVNGSIPRVMNEEVEREIASFQGREREFFVESYLRSGLWRPMILEELRRSGLPEQLSWLPLVESGFKVRALSRARALGLWQFIPSTGYRYGLERDNWVDERMEPVKATRAAIAYLTDLHGLFGDWLTALAAYNCGEGTVLRQIRNQQVSYFDQFWDIYARLPRETRRYVPRFLATLAILDDPAAYGFDLPEPLPPVDAERLEVSRPVELVALDRSLGLDKGTLAALNPELRWGATPEEPYPLRIPAGRGDALVTSLDEMPEFVPRAARTTVHRVRSGDSLWRLAQRYGTTVDRIQRDNRLSGNLLRPGQRLRIRGGGGAPSGGGGTYTVQRGDTLGGVASRHGISLRQLLALNHLSARSTIYPGQRLTIP